MKNCKRTNINIYGKDITLFYRKNDDYINIADFANSKYDKRTTFNYAFFDFGDFFTNMINSKESDRVFAGSEVYGLESVNNLLEKHFKKIKSYSNGKVLLNYKFAKEVLNSFKEIYSELDERFGWTKENFFIVPLKGGGFVINLFDLKNKKVLPVEAKRIPSKQKGELGLGMNLDEVDLPLVNFFMEEINERNIVFLEVCIASGMTTIGFLLDLYNKGVRPKQVKIFTAASSIQGIRIVQKVADLIGYKVIFYTGKLIENVSDFYDVSQDSIIYDDGSFVVKSPESAYKIVYGI